MSLGPHITINDDDRPLRKPRDPIYGMLLAASKRRKVWFELRVDGTVKLCRIDNARDVLGEFKDAPSAIKFLDAMENLPSAGDGE